MAVAIYAVILKDKFCGFCSDLLLGNLHHQILPSQANTFYGKDGLNLELKLQNHSLVAICKT